MNPDIIVIGAGFAGLMAAYRAAERGARVTLLAKGVGTTHWASGGIDVLGYHPIDNPWAVENPREALLRLIADEPTHPYAHVNLDDVQASLDTLQRVARTHDLYYVGSLDRNFLLPTMAGAVKPSCLVPQNRAAGEVRQPGETLVLGFARLRDFYPSLIAANLTAQGFPARGVSLEVPEIDRHKTMTSVILAQMLDDPPIRREVIQRARAALGSEQRIGFPAVLGFKRHTQVVEELEQALDRPVFEIPTMPPSASGFRLFEAFRHALQAKGVRVVIGSQVVKATHANGRALTVETEAAARTVRHSAPQFILATGGVAGGGLLTDYQGGIRETVFGLPVSAPATRQAWFEGRFLAPRGQPIFRAGIRVNDSLQPLDADGQVVLENVRVAGAALAGWDAWREQSHEGVCLTTGWKAANLV
ncbi:MAG: glycerol-3-phosphate dehydrogenase subunit GlpB [Anaerolineae bacterium]|nr:glycerol-3-phosphate dehydrogenase subunit GlpB [Anaerolineae bacterium]